MSRFKIVSIFCLFIFCSLGVAHSRFVPNQRGDRELVRFPEGAQIVEEHELDRSNFYDPEADYSSFEGRVSDRDESSSILKIYSDNPNIKFFRAGDPLSFRIQRRNFGECQAQVRDVEPDYLIIFVRDLRPCWPRREDDYFRRGTALIFSSDRLEERVREASRHRHALLRRREDFFNQLNEVNRFLWSFDQQRVIVSAQYDRKIERLEQEKLEALSALTSKKIDQARIQRELITLLDELDKDISHYRIESSQGFNRWGHDHNTGLPVMKRPAEMTQDSRSQSMRAID